jgi:hypothetical protein
MVLSRPVMGMLYLCCWRIKTNQYINYILKGQNVIRFTKKPRLIWLRYFERMTEDNILQKIKRRKPMSKLSTERRKLRWKDDVLEDVRSMNVGNWKNVAQNRECWKRVVERARTLYRL